MEDRKEAQKKIVFDQTVDDLNARGRNLNFILKVR